MLALTAAVGIGVAACTAVQTGDAPDRPSPQAIVPTPDTSPRPDASPPSEAAVTPGDRTELVTGLEAPWGLTFLPDGSALVSLRLSGEIVRVPPAGGTPEPVGVVPDVETSAEGGLLGIAASPRFASDRTEQSGHVAEVPVDRLGLHAGGSAGALRVNRAALPYMRRAGCGLLLGGLRNHPSGPALPGPLYRGEGGVRRFRGVHGLGRGSVRDRDHGPHARGVHPGHRALRQSRRPG